MPCLADCVVGERSTLSCALIFRVEKELSAPRGGTRYRSTGHLVRNRKPVPGWISYLTMGMFDTNFSTMTPESLIFL